MRAHLARLGGVLIRPRPTLLAILRGELDGRAWEIFPWIAIVAAASAPIQAGRAILIGRVDPLLGIWTFLALIADRSSAGMIGAVVAALLVQRLGHSFDRAFDCAMYLLAPYLLLASIGALMSALGGEVWFLPHRRLTGSALVLSIRILVAYGWSLALFIVVLREVVRERRAGSTARDAL